MTSSGRLDMPEEEVQTVKELQQEYNSLLKKYARAENTIDQLRLGAKVTLYADWVTGGQGQKEAPPTSQQGRAVQTGLAGPGTDKRKGSLSSQGERSIANYMVFTSNKYVHLCVLFIFSILHIHV